MFEAQDHGGKAVAPTYLLYLLLEKDACTEREFCLACGELLRGEGWTGYKAIQAAWEAIPINCSQYLDTDLLPYTHRQLESVSHRAHSHVHTPTSKQRRNHGLASSRSWLRAQ